MLDAMTDLLHADDQGSFITGRVPRLKKVPSLSAKSGENNSKDHKTRLQNLLARDQKPLPHYTVMEDLARSINSRYKATVHVGVGVNRRSFVGGPAISKKVAEHHAAKVALDTLLPEQGGSRQGLAGSGRKSMWRARKGPSSPPSSQRNAQKVSWDESGLKAQGGGKERRVPFWRKKKGVGGLSQEKGGSGVGGGQGGSGSGSGEAGNVWRRSEERVGGKKQAYRSAL